MNPLEWALVGVTGVVAYLALIIWCMGAWIEGLGRVQRAASTALLFVVTVAGVAFIIKSVQDQGKDPNCLQQERKAVLVHHPKGGYSTERQWVCTMEGTSSDEVLQ